ncbi:MAG TPA: ATP synthase subunit I [Bacillota bacterium]|nr:ATP synthase subunit I [Bacillota bacterium]
MQQFERMIYRQRKYMLFILMTFIIGAIITPYSQVFFGLLLGSCISFYNQLLLHRKIALFGEKVIRAEKPKGLGFISRLAAVAFAVIIVLRFPEHFNVIALLIGLMVSYLVLAIDFMKVNMLDDSGRGEKGG